MPGRRMSEGDRQEDILRAAYDIAARRGLTALTLRAVAERAKVSHGTVLFHFKRRDHLVAALLDRVLYATVILRMPYDVQRLTRPSDRVLALLRAEMERLTSEARNFRLFLEYWTLGVRSAPLRSTIKTALGAYRHEWRSVCEAVVLAAQEFAAPGRGRPRAADTGLADADGLAAVAVSLVHGCALQAVIDGSGFNIQQHYDAAARLLDAAIRSEAPEGDALRSQPRTVRVR
jgi:AcrR family transcriptional regulator